MVDLSMDGLGQAFDKIVDLAEPLIFAGGFVFGATEAASAGGHYQSIATQYGSTAAMEFRISDAIAFATGQQVSIGGYQSDGSFTFKPLGFVNNGLYAAVGAWLYKEMKLPYAKEIYKVVWPFGLGYSIGGFFDPALPAQMNGRYQLSTGINPGYAASMNPIQVATLNAGLS